MKVLLTSIPMSGGDNLFRIQFIIVFISFVAKAKCTQVKLCVRACELQKSLKALRDPATQARLDAENTALAAQLASNTGEGEGGSLAAGLNIID